MAKKPRHTPEQAIGKRREAEVKRAKGAALARVCKDPSATENTCYRRRREYGGMELDQARRLEDLEGEDARLERLLADAEPDEAILREAASGRYRARRGGARRSSTSGACSARIAARGAGRAGSWASPAPRHGAPAVADDEPRPAARMVEPACEYGRYGDRRVTAPLRAEGFRVNRKRIERLWRGEGLKVPQEPPKKGRPWPDDGSCARPRPAHEDHVRSCDFVQARARDGRASRMLTVIGEYTRACPAIDVARRRSSDDVPERLSDLFVRRGAPGHIRSDNGPEFTAKAVRERLGRVGVKTLYIEPGGPREDGYIESSNGELRAGLPGCAAFGTLPEARVLIEGRRRVYSTIRPHSSPGYRPPAPEAIVPWTPASGVSLLGPASMAEAVGALS